MTHTPLAPRHCASAAATRTSRRRAAAPAPARLAHENHDATCHTRLDALLVPHAQVRHHVVAHIHSQTMLHHTHPPIPACTHESSAYEQRVDCLAQHM